MRHPDAQMLITMLGNSLLTIFPMNNSLETEFGAITDLIRQHALRSPLQRALVQG